MHHAHRAGIPSRLVKLYVCLNELHGVRNVHGPLQTSHPFEKAAKLWQEAWTPAPGTGFVGVSCQDECRWGRGPLRPELGAVFYKGFHVRLDKKFENPLD